MNNPETSNYIQYLTQNGFVKSTQVFLSTQDDKTLISFNPINESFFILSLFINNKRVFGVGFENQDNINQLAFLNSDITDIDLVPNQSFFNEFTSVILSFYTSSVIQITTPLKTNEQIYFEQVCQSVAQSQSSTFTIVPFFAVIGVGYPLLEISSNNYELFFCNLKETTAFDIVDATFNVYVKSLQITSIKQGYQLFTHLHYNATTLDERLLVHGYRAIFSEVIFYDGR